ncbi:MAG: CDP-diacylglycerol--serine O-phosphatidyltransferase [Reichenbachiella sp.]
MPNFLTSANLFIGCLAIIEIFEGKLENVIYYVIASGVMDFFDGFAARLTKSTSNIGKDLDSLADMVSFSLVPALLMYQMVLNIDSTSQLAHIPLIIAVLSALRLAKFNNDTRQTDHFHGLPVPANALLISAIPYIHGQGYFVSILDNLFVLVGISIVMALLLVADYPLIALKFKNYKWQDNKPQYILIISSIISLATFQLVALPFVILFYIVISIFDNVLTPNKKLL